MDKHSQLKAFKPIDRLRRISGVKPVDQSKLRAAMTRIWRSEDGKLLLEFLYQTSHGAILPVGASDLELRDRESNRRYVDRILALIEEPNERSARKSTKPTAAG